MGHEITSTDNIVLHKYAAWHGLGLLVENAPTPREALTLAGLDWGVDQRYLFSERVAEDPNRPGKKIIVRDVVDGYVANYRMDTNEVLGLVSENYVPVQNVNVADFCEQLVADGKTARVETAGSIKGGKRVWFLLKGKEFEVANGDGMFPYLLVSNGHDGKFPYRVTPTTIRVVCANTMHAAIPDAEGQSLGRSAYIVRHTQNAMQQVAEVQAALANYNVAREQVAKLADDLSKVSATSDEFKQFFLECYTEDYGIIPTQEAIKAETDKKKQRTMERRVLRSQSAYNSFSKRFDDEREIARASWWNAFNAYSGLVQNDQKIAGKDDEDRIAKRTSSNLLGLNQERTQAALQRAWQRANGIVVA